MTSDGSPLTRFRRSIEVMSVTQAELAMREMRRVGLLDALDYCVLLAAEVLLITPLSGMSACTTDAIPKMPPPTASATNTGPP
jgi:hypothetical protein